MMQRWADHCSSDEDTDDNYSLGEEEEPAIEEDLSSKLQVNDEEEPQIEKEPEPPVRTYDFPDRPPFTAFVGNLSYDIQEASQLQQQLADVVLERLGERVNVLGGKICYDRDSPNGQHRGFGYVELESLEELKIVMRLNDDGQATLAGRKIQVDTANNKNNRSNNSNRKGSQNNRRNSNRDEKIDGTKFRGGKFNNTNNFRNSFRNSNHQSGPPRERTSLKLAPRSKPVEGGDRSSSSDIFGGAKARDEQAWERSRQQKEVQKKEVSDHQKKEEATGGDAHTKKIGKDKTEGSADSLKGKNSAHRRESGRGRGGKGRGNHHRNSGNGGRGDANNKKVFGKRSQHEKKNDKKKPQTEEKTSKNKSKPVENTPSNPEPKPPKNKFALLMDDSDSD